MTADLPRRPLDVEEGLMLIASEVDSVGSVTHQVRTSQTHADARWVVIVAAAAAVVLSTVALGLVLATRDHSLSIEPGVPREVSADELRSFALSTGHVVYWAGTIRSHKLELTQSRQGAVYVRYLPGDARAGDERPAFTTVGTFPLARAYARTVGAARREGTTERQAPGGGIVMWRLARPSSVYLAYPGSDFLVEVYDPVPSRARALALSGDVGPIR